MIEKHLKLNATFNVYPIFQHLQIFCIKYLKDTGKAKIEQLLRFRECLGRISILNRLYRTKLAVTFNINSIGLSGNSKYLTGLKFSIHDFASYYLEYSGIL